MLNERNKANQQKKNKVMGRRRIIPPRELADREVHDHGSNAETVGRLRGVKKKRGEKKKDELFNRAGPVGKLPDHTVYHDMGYLMAEALGLVSEGEVKRKNKAMKNKKYVRANFPEGQASDDVTPAYNPHGTSEHGPGHMRGKKKVGKVAEENRDLDRARDSGAPRKGTPFKRGGDRSDSVDRARAAYEAKVKRQSQNMIGADEEPSEAKKSRQARERGGTKERVSAAQGVKAIMRGKKPKLKIKPSTKKKLMEKPKAPKYK